MVIALPLVLTVLFLAVQAGTWFYARSIALAAAQSGARTSAMLNAAWRPGCRTGSFADDVGGATLTGVTVTGDRSATSTTVTVTGGAVRLVPFMDLTVAQTATLPVERYTVMTRTRAAAGTPPRSAARRRSSW